ncbi:hypothetical protein [Lentibacillus jeotgali]|uniref:hypothetical protein n=1 Tax=Lentibacillus jeotgali TaxID=558169 RepID=UPI0002627035|nr:hypothetical protein [Lentibacillus jeotgali]
MKKPVTLYQFCRAFKGINSNSTTKQKQNFAWAIGSAESIIAASFRKKSLRPVEGYFELKKRHALTDNFMKSFSDISYTKYRLGPKYSSGNK